MTASFLRTCYQMVQLLVCILFVMEKMQPLFSPNGAPPLATTHVRPRPLASARLIWWRRFLFLLG